MTPQLSTAVLLAHLDSGSQPTEKLLECSKRVAQWVKRRRSGYHSVGMSMRRTGWRLALKTRHVLKWNGFL